MSRAGFSGRRKRVRVWVEQRKALAAVEEAMVEGRHQTARSIVKRAKDGMKWAANAPDGPPSKPGRYPKRETGELADSIRVHRTAKRVRIIVDAAHGIYLELGTRKMARRPFLRPAVGEVKDIPETLKAFRNLRVGLTLSGRSLNAMMKAKRRRGGFFPAALR